MLQHSTSSLEPQADVDQAAPAALFPLKVTPFEFYYLLEDRPNYPSVFPVRLECRGPLDVEALKQAYQLAHARHPFLSARVEQKPLRWPVWIAGEPAPIRWTVDAPTGPEALHASTSAAGIEMQVTRAGDKTVMAFWFHHVATDGMGAFQFISDLMAAYAHACSSGTEAIAWRPLNRQLLRDRDGHRLFGRQMRLRDVFRLVRVTLPLLFRRAAVVSEPPEQPAAADSAPGSAEFLVHTLTERETTDLSRVARSLPVRLNDLLLRDYFLMLQQWNRDTPQGRRPLRVLVPTNLRRKQDYRMPAANVFSYAFLTRRGRDCSDRSELLESLRGEMAMVRREKWGVYFEAGLRLFCTWPLLLRLSLKRKWPFATAIFTNLGAGFDHIPLPWQGGKRVAGDLVLENGFGAGPIRPETRVSLAVHTYAGRMSIAVQCDPQAFTAQQQRDILQAYIDQLRLTIKLNS